MDLNSLPALSARHPVPIAVCYDRGIYLPELALWLDPSRKKKVAFVSHAHADHFARHGTIFCSERTHALIRKRYGNLPRSVIIPLAYGERHDFNADYHLQLLPAGHILGSAQIHLTRKADGATLLYTGDFKLRKSYAAETVIAAQAQTLVMETTFGLPRYRFPPTEQVALAVESFCRETLQKNEIPILLAYSLGKAQEILASLAQANLPIMLYRTVHEMTAVYAQYSDIFPVCTPWDPDRAAGHVLIVPPTVARSPAIAQLPNTRKAMLSGWAAEKSAVYRYGVDAAFPLSDHADYADLLRYVDLVKPDLVYTLHGFAAEFARDLRAKAIEAWSIVSDNQLDLGFTVERNLPPAP